MFSLQNHVIKTITLREYDEMPMPRPKAFFFKFEDGCACTSNEAAWRDLLLADMLGPVYMFKELKREGDWAYLINGGLFVSHDFPLMYIEE